MTVDLYFVGSMGEAFAFSVLVSLRGLSKQVMVFEISQGRSEVGGKRVCKDRAPQPGGRFVPSVRAARSVIHVESGIK